MKTSLPTRKQSVLKNSTEFSTFSPSQKIRALEKQRKTFAYLKSLKEDSPGMKSQGDVEPDPVKLIRRFNRENVRYLLIGSMALAMHDAPFGSADI